MTYTCARDCLRDVAVSFEDASGCWRERQSLTTQDGLVSSQYMSLRPIADGTCRIELTDEFGLERRVPQHMHSSHGGHHHGTYAISSITKIYGLHPLVQHNNHHNNAHAYSSLAIARFSRVSCEKSFVQYCSSFQSRSRRPGSGRRCAYRQQQQQLLLLLYVPSPHGAVNALISSSSSWDVAGELHRGCQLQLGCGWQRRL